MSSERKSKHLEKLGTAGREQAGAGKWLAWNREQTRIIACRRTRAQAMAAAQEAGEPEPVLENVEATRERFADLYTGGAELRQELLVKEGEPLTELEVSALLHLSPLEVEERRATAALLAVTVDGRAYLYPSWQFMDDAPLPGLEDVLADLRIHNRHPLAQVRFLISPSLRLEGKTPLSELRRGRIDEVRQAARTYGEHGAA